MLARVAWNCLVAIDGDMEAVRVGLKDVRSDVRSGLRYLDAILNGRVGGAAGLLSDLYTVSGSVEGRVEYSAVQCSAVLPLSICQCLVFCTTTQYVLPETKLPLAISRISST